MAEVYEAVREGPHGFAKRVALKRILPQSIRDPEFMAMFIEEARLAARLEHPNIVQVFDFGEDHGELFIVMELVDGTNLNRMLRRIARDRGTIPLEVALLIGARIAGALAYAHRLVDEEGKSCAIVHRDVSPANILVSRSGHAKLADFGIATITSRLNTTEPGQVRGKLGYMSPEQVSGRGLDGKSDVFTLATVLTELVTGEPLFGIGSVIDVLVRIRDANVGTLERARGNFAEDARHLLLRGLARDPRERPTALSFSAE
ncbi:MAG: serine/threonine protein kinase, partial [Myxococcales bacterium]|nr:serine/threonine protein kinase [Myxococcales bacterium]